MLGRKVFTSFVLALAWMATAALAQQAPAPQESILQKVQRTKVIKAGYIPYPPFVLVDPNTKKLVNAQGQPFEFEILLLDPVYERVTLPFVKNLQRLGVTAKVRTVDTSQFKKRMDDYDFDMVIDRWLQSLSPGNEQRTYWGSATADQPGSRNSLGLKDPVVDALIGEIVAAPDRASLVARVHALDRVLQWGYYVVPNWYIAYDRVAYWDKFGQPTIVPTQGVQIDTWWVDPAKEAALAAKR